MAKRGRKKHPTRTLPTDIIQNEILIKLPPKPLLKCRSVSKLWCSIIDDPKFSQSHLKEHQNNQDSTRLLVLEPPDVGYAEQICTIRNSKSFRKMSRHDIELNPWRMHYKAVGYINGVVCLKKYRSEFQPCKIILWNPSIKKALEIPFPEVTLSNLPELGLRFDIDCAFGYDAVKNDYKVVTSVYVRRGDNQIMVPIIEIFTLSTFSCKRAHSTNDPCVWVIDGPKVFLDGVTYWCASDKNKFDTKGKCSHFASFNAVTNVFTYIDLPDCEQDIVWAHDRFPIILDQSIGLMETFETYSHIWVMDNDRKDHDDMVVIWKKLYTINIPLLYKCLYFKIDGELFFTEGNGGVKSCNIKTGEIKVLAKTYKISPVFVDVYKESMALLSGVPKGALTFSPSTIP